jgi:hypothetical protein
VGTPLLASWSWAGTVGLIVLGAFISLVSTVIVEERKVREEKAREKRERARKLRASARIVRDELLGARVAIESTVEHKRWTWNASEPLSTLEWGLHKQTLADAIDEPGKWATIVVAYNGVRLANLARAWAGETGDIPDSDIRLMTSAIEEALKANDALRSLESV